MSQLSEILFGRNPGFENPPMTPEQSGLFNQARGYTQPGGSPTMNLLAPIIMGILQGQSGGVQMPNTLPVPGMPGTGGPTLYQGSKPNIDWVKVMQAWAQMQSPAGTSSPLGGGGSPGMGQRPLPNVFPQR